ncbi:MAG TPA: N-acetyltransferase [Rhodothermales bacterium]|nr:N-acetyltransferase [Rhodothermales bacterium]
MIHIRPERPDDLAAVAHVNEAAFGRYDEARLVDRLRARVPAYLAFVATLRDVVVGHIAFTPVTLDPPRPDLDVRGLAPMAVLPDNQRAGVGSALVRAGLDACRASGAQAVVVLGHPVFYPRFGFVPADRFGLRSEYDVPPEAFMAQELVPGALTDIRGTVRYNEAFEG